MKALIGTSPSEKPNEIDAYIVDRFFFLHLHATSLLTGLKGTYVAAEIRGNNGASNNTVYVSTSPTTDESEQEEEEERDEDDYVDNDS